MGQDPATQVPSYEHLNGVDLGTASSNSPENIIISTAVDSQGFIYTLSFGNGVDKLNPNGTINESQLISAADLESPLDIEVDSSGKIYIADYFESGSCLDNGKVKIFSSNGNLENEIAKSYFRPLGLAIDRDDKIYIAEYYDGSTCENGEESRIRVFNQDGNFIDGTNNVEIPYRLAVNSNYKLFVSQAGNDNPQVLIFDENLNQNGTLSNVISPGSIFIDEFDFIHIIEYAGRVDFEKFLNYDQLGFFELLVLASNIQQGINNNEFGFKIFNPTQGFEYYYQDGEIRFPVDIAINNLVCDSKLYLNNANISGTSLQFDLEIYERTPSFDLIDPIAECVGDFDLPLVNGSASISVEDINNGSTDNCGIESITLSQTTFTAADVYDVVMIVTDNAGNKDTCTVKVTVTGDEEPSLEITCVGTKEVQLLDDQPVTVLAEDIVSSDTSGLSFSPASFEFDCSDIGTQDIEITATDEETGATDFCVVAITVKDEKDPVVNCVAAGKEFQLENGSVTIAVSDIELSSSDNCGISTKTLSETTFTTSGTKNITLFVEDEAGNISDCTTSIEILPEEVPYEFKCIGDLTVNLGEEAQNSSVTEIPTSDFITSDISNLDLELSLQQFTCEDIGTNPLTIRATDKETGDEYSCTVNVTVKDVGAPLIICPAEAQTREIPANGIYVLPEVVDMFGISDNCAADEELVIVQDPPPGTEFTEEGDYEIILTATDPYDNTETCEVTYRLTKSSDTVAPEISCPENISFENDTGVCGAVINFQDAMATDDSGGEVTIQRTDNIDLISGNVFPVGTYTISYTATDESNNVSDCSFEIEVIDSQAPVLECKSSYELSFPRGETRILEPEELLNSFRDNCEGQDISLSLDRSQFTEEDDGQTINVTVTAFDSKNNSTSCVVPVNIVVVEEDELVLSCIDEYLIMADENCNYRVPDFSEILNYNPATASITQSIEAGSIIRAETSIEVTASFEDQIQSCTIALNFEDDISPTISCPGDQVLNITEGGVARVPDFSDQIDADDNCGIVEVIQDPLPGTEITTDTNISISVLDAAGNRVSCDFELQLMTGDELMISCPADKILEWDENCSFTLPDYTGEAEVFNGNGLEVIQDPLPGTVVTDSEFEVSLRVENGSDSDSCSFKISLEDNTPPVLQLNNVSRNLNGEGIAFISFEDIDNGSFDSCDPDVTYTLSKSVFSCKELGTNLVQVTAEDSSGNTSSGSVTVSITDEFDFCEAPPTQGSEYIFIYPNPNTGSFKVATPADVTIQRLEVFDHRGRFIAAKDYEENVSEYALELGPLQEAVYVVKIITNKEMLHKRFIFKY
ncbi:HYR domain-containing protein [Christiangramia sediminis]|uniref:HYR domain-containing protein n=1 Tax=Christiangramia sediminis TaxID=2881336 RepID=A0A9X1LG16_9FLAO|nr:HYR domain-containing protein [Christiangramia sediminis]MCB7479679.1 HYR domain-containing protein [Christiangramia sediminis]